MKVRKIGKVGKGSITVVSILLDKSGSMDPNRKATISAINEYIDSLKKDGNKYKFNLTFFDTELEKPYSNVDIKSVGKLNEDIYRPDGMTALYDAVYTTASDLENRLDHGSAYEGDKVLFVIMTDGMENSSHEHSQSSVSYLIKRLQDKNWTFVFLGANQDSWTTAETWGLSTMNISNFNATPMGIGKMFNVLGHQTACFASASGSSTKDFFTKQDQDKLQQQR